MQSIRFHFKYPNFIRGAKTILHPAQNPVRRMPVPLKIKHRIHHMLQHSRTCHRSFLGHMTDNQDGNIEALRKTQEYSCCFSYL